MFSQILLTITFAVGSWSVNLNLAFNILEKRIAANLNNNSGIVTSVIRFASFFGSSSFTDSTWTSVEHMTWTQVEPGVYLISACMPTWRPVVEMILPPIISATKSSVFRSGKKRSMNDDSIQLQAHNDIRGFERLENSRDKKRYPRSDDILVTTDFSVVDRSTHATEDCEVIHQNSRGIGQIWDGPKGKKTTSYTV